MSAKIDRSTRLAVRSPADHLSGARDPSSRLGRRSIWTAIPLWICNLQLHR